MRINLDYLHDCSNLRRLLAENPKLPLDNNLSVLARELIRIGVIGSVDFEKLAGDEE